MKKLLYAFNREEGLDPSPRNCFMSFFGSGVYRPGGGHVLVVYAMDEGAKPASYLRSDVEAAGGEALLIIQTDFLIDTWARACALQVGHMWRHFSTNKHAWKAAMKLLWSPSRTGDWNYEPLRQFARSSASGALQTAADYLRILLAGSSLTDRDHDREIVLSEVAIFSARAAETLLPKAEPMPGSMAARAIDDSVVAHAKASGDGETANIVRMQQNDMLRALIGAIVYTAGFSDTFTPSPHLDWWWHWQIVWWYQPLFLKGGSEEASRRYGSTKNMLTLLRGEDNLMMRRVLVEGWKRYWKNKGKEAQDWPIIWAACKGGGAL